MSGPKNSHQLLNGHKVQHVLFVRSGELESNAALRIVSSFDPSVEVVTVQSDGPVENRITPELFSPKSIFAGLEPIEAYIRQEKKSSPLSSRG